MKLPLRISPAARAYATRRAERPPPKIKDPLEAPNAIHHHVTPSLTFIHRVPPTAPSPFSLTTAPSSPLLLSRAPSTFQSDNASSGAGGLPPLMKAQHEKPVRRLNDEQIEEIRRLRAENPLKHTRSKLAKQFGCSPLFIPIAAPLEKAEKRKALERRDREHEENRNHWGERKRMAVAIKQKRRSLW